MFGQISKIITIRISQPATHCQGIRVTIMPGLCVYVLWSTISMMCLNINQNTENILANDILIFVNLNGWMYKRYLRPSDRMPNKRLSLWWVHPCCFARHAILFLWFEFDWAVWRLAGRLAYSVSEHFTTIQAEIYANKNFAINITR